MSYIRGREILDKKSKNIFSNVRERFAKAAYPLGFALLIYVGSACASPPTSEWTYKPQSYKNVLTTGRGYDCITPVVMLDSEKWVGHDSRNPHCVNGLRFLYSGEWTKAISEYSEALKQEPNNGVALAHRAAAYNMAFPFRNQSPVTHYAKAFELPRGGKQRMTDLVMADLAAALKLHPECARLFRNRAVINTWIGKGGTIEVLRDCETAVRLDAQDVACFNTAGMFQSFAGNQKRAIELFTAAIKLEPRGSFLYTQRGRAYWRDGDYRQCINDETKAIALEPNSNTLAYYERGLSYAAQREFSKSFTDFAKAYEVEPRNIGAITERATIAVAAHKYDMAIADATHAISQGGAENGEIYLIRAFAYEGLKKFNQARRDCDIALSYNKRSVRALLLSAGLHNNNGDKDEAMSEVLTVLKAYPNNSAALKLKSQLEGNVGQLEQAMSDFIDAQRAETIKTSNVTIEKQSGNFARTLVTTEAHMSKRAADATFKRGVAPTSEALNASIQGYTKVIRLKKASVESYFNRGMLLLCAGDLVKARSDFETCIELNEAGRTGNMAKLLLYIVLKESNQEVEAKNVITDTKWNRVSGDSAVPRVVQYLKGEKSADALLLTTHTNSDRTLAHLFIGINCRIKGDAMQAQKHLKWIRDNADMESDEYTLGLIELKKLSSKA